MIIYYQIRKIQKEKAGCSSKRNIHFWLKSLEFLLPWGCRGWSQPEGKLKQSLGWWLLRNKHPRFQEISGLPALCRWQFHWQSKFSTKMMAGISNIYWKNLKFVIMLHLCFNKLSNMSILSFVSFLENLDIFKNDGVIGVLEFTLKTLCIYRYMKIKELKEIMEWECVIYSKNTD